MFLHSLLIQKKNVSAEHKKNVQYKNNYQNKQTPSMHINQSHTLAKKEGTALP